MEGASLATSYMSRTTTSYLNREIRWGHKFTQCITWDKENRKYVVNHKLFNKTEEAATPLCSARRFLEVYDDVLSQTLSPYEGSLLSDSSKYSSPSTLSPLITNPRTLASSDVPNQQFIDDDGSISDDEAESTKAVVSADIHYRPKNDNEKSECNSTSSSEDEAEKYTTFMDLSVEDLAEERPRKADRVVIRTRTNSGSEVRPRTLSGQAKDFLVSLQKFVTEGSGSKTRTSRKYEETSF